MVITNHPLASAAGAEMLAAGGIPQGDYAPADTLNVLAAFWIQFMTHDWFSPMEDGHNGAQDAFHSARPAYCRSSKSRHSPSSSRPLSSA